MTEPKDDRVDKAELVQGIADLSRLLGMIPSDDTITIHEPVTDNSMQLSQWLKDTRDSFLKLSVLLDKSLGLDLQ